jgi:hypothetical protein
MSNQYRMIQLTTEVALPEFEITDRRHPYDGYLEWHRLKMLKEPTDFNRYCYVKALCGDMQFDRAWSYISQCSATAPVTQFFQSYILLHQGNYRDGLRLRESRFLASKFPLHFVAPQWDGKPTDKKLIIWQEGGFGDVIQYSRYLPQVLERCPNASAVIEKHLYPIINYNFKDTLPAFNPHDFQLQCSFMSLPYLLDKMPATHPYLGLPNEAAEKWSNYSGKIGFIGKGNPSHSSDKLRSLTDEEIARLMYGKDWVSLDPAETGAKDWLDTAGIIANLDLVIGIDTGVCHLAGAMGKPVWVMMNKHHDWRWSRSWYDSMRIVKCTEHSDWGPVFQRIEIELAVRNQMRMQAAE